MFHIYSDDLSRLCDMTYVINCDNAFNINTFVKWFCHFQYTYFQLFYMWNIYFCFFYVIIICCLYVFLIKCLNFECPYNLRTQLCLNILCKRIIAVIIVSLLLNYSHNVISNIIKVRYIILIKYGRLPFASILFWKAKFI